MNAGKKCSSVCKLILSPIAKRERLQRAGNDCGSLIKNYAGAMPGAELEVFCNVGAIYCLNKYIASSTSFIMKLCFHSLILVSRILSNEQICSKWLC